MNQAAYDQAMAALSEPDPETGQRYAEAIRLYNSAIQIDLPQANLLPESSLAIVTAPKKPERIFNRLRRPRRIFSVALAACAITSIAVLPAHLERVTQRVSYPRSAT